jgi:hypothetical protein
LPDDAEVRFLKSLCAAATAAAAPPVAVRLTCPASAPGGCWSSALARHRLGKQRRRRESNAHAPRAAALGLNARAALLDNDAYGFFSAIDSLLVTGPTLTNVNDFHAILVS